MLKTLIVVASVTFISAPASVHAGELGETVQETAVKGSVSAASVTTPAQAEPQFVGINEGGLIENPRYRYRGDSPLPEVPVQKSQRDVVVGI
jgi:hypothetical protein